MRRKKLVIALLFVVLLAAAIPTVYAYMFRSTETLNNVFEPANVACSVVENFTTNDKNVQEKTSVQVKNTGNVEAYLRVRFVVHWEDSKGYVVARDFDPIDVQITDYWIKADDGYTFYCKKPITPGESTENLLNQPISLLPVIEKFEGNGGLVINYEYYPVIEIISEAIQSQPANAVQDSWKVTLDGVNITGVAAS